ncbi:gamma-glutamylcyclotransferase [Roseateles sp. DAIF2]|uniref:gamma-glutamylcyclotransferase n=1 Tax=Roseateles sp. DAIF2 TaxID=2714952 RepID=UPI0018A29B5E|nr:gamma-glutamylcyclotransferase [Roseateles sp. DAIF2]QPF73865.1 gamma-glutamylcyclotransferase [Roseateles sp. DAIF2]
MLQEYLDHVRGRDLHLFAYGSLIWRPEFEFDEQQRARIQGFHRALRMHSRLYRGTPERPGLVLALLSGGCCVGMLYRIGAARAEAVLRQVWAREMVSGVYRPRWLSCQPQHGGQGVVPALAFTLSRRNPHWTGALSDAELLSVFRHARGRYGSTLDYLQRTVQSLRSHGIHDRELERQHALAVGHGLCEPLPVHLARPARSAC